MNTTDNIAEFELSIYPCTLWVTVSTDLEDIFERFDVACMNDFYRSRDRTISQIIDEYPSNCCATTTPVIERETDKIGVLVIINPDLICSGTVAHESVHVADYVFELTGSNSEDFSIGNEPYAHLVGWAADCMFQVIKNTKNDGKERRQRENKGRFSSDVNNRKFRQNTYARSAKIR